MNVHLSEGAGKVELTVSDTGVGIPPSERDKVFERFYRVEGSAPGGSGLGLAIVSEIAAAHKATVELENVHPTGTKFTLRFDMMQ